MPVKRGKTQGIICVLVFLAVLALDQVTKSIVHSTFSAGQSVPIVKNALHFTFVRNTGAAFGLFKNSTNFFVLVSILAVAFISVVIYRSVRKGEFLNNYFCNFGLILVMAGAFGNLIDRVRFSYVIDFIDVRIWPVFNIADSAITIGSVILVIAMLGQRRQIDKP
ncbi:MAG: signal peptidase II [Candidatus Omnitrophota bacterium]